VSITRAAWGHPGGVRRQLGLIGGASPHSYVGHGAGARFLDGQTISRLDCRAVTLLFGCSSAALAVRGSLEGSGIILKYIMAGW